LNEGDTVKLLRDIKRILSVICLASISNLKKQFLITEKDQRVYDLCTRKTAEEIANAMPDLGYSGVYERVSLWEKNGLIISEEKASGRGRPRKHYMKVEMFLE
jgi:transposase